MRRIIVFFVVSMLVGAGVAWAGNAAYKLVMSKDKELCTSMLKLFNEDMKKYGEIRYDQHEVFTRVSWQSVEVEEDKGSFFPYCSAVQKAKVDVNNDGQDEWVIKWSACLKGQPIDHIYVFPSNTEWIQRPTWANLSLLGDAPNKFDGYGTNLEPFIWGKTVFISMTSVYDSTWIVIAKYLHGEEFQDICNFKIPSSK